MAYTRSYRRRSKSARKISKRGGKRRRQGVRGKSGSKKRGSGSTKKRRRTGNRRNKTGGSNNLNPIQFSKLTQAINKGSGGLIFYHQGKKFIINSNFEVKQGGELQRPFDPHAIVQVDNSEFGRILETDN